MFFLNIYNATWGIMLHKMPPFRKKKSGKSFPVKVCSLDAELEFNLGVSLALLHNEYYAWKWYLYFLQWRATGRDLFDLVCRTIGLRETWYFGLQFEDSKGFISWLKLDKKGAKNSTYKQPLLIKHFPFF